SRELAYRPQSEDGDRASLRNGGVFDCLPGGGEDVGEEEITVVRVVVAHGDRPEIRVRDPEKLCLAPGHRAVQLGVAEEPSALVLFTHLRGFALGEETSITHEASAAGDVERNHHPITRSDMIHLGTDLLDDTHRLVAEDVTFIEVHPEDLVQMQVGPTDGGRRDPDDGVGRLLDHRGGHVTHPQVAFDMPGDGLHRCTLVAWRGATTGRTAETCDGQNDPSGSSIAVTSSRRRRKMVTCPMSNVPISL